MKTINIDVCSKNTIPLGMQYENNVRKIVFDISSFIELYGAGYATLSFQRSKDEEPYPISLSQSGNYANWTVNSTDTDVEGFGVAQITWHIGTKVAKTKVMPTRVCGSIVTELTEPPEVFATWISQFTTLAATTLQNSQSATKSANEASASANKAKKSEDNAKISESNAASSATEAESALNDFKDGLARGDYKGAKGDTVVATFEINDQMELVATYTVVAHDETEV